MKLLERYSEAVNSDNLAVNPRTVWSDSDVLGAAGLAGKHNALGLEITRLLSGGKPGPVIETLTQKAWKRARTLGVSISRVQAHDLSVAVLSWYRFGTCQPCGGTGFHRITNTPTLGDECSHCTGTGRIPFDRQFHQDTLELARWLSGEIDRVQASAGSDAMKALADRMDL